MSYPFDMIQESLLIQNRQYLHKHPELSFMENQTMHYICACLKEYGVSCRDGVAATGVVAQIDGAKKGPCILIRADMDALPLQEKTGLSFASQTDGVMHACGHDAHTAILLETCRVLQQQKHLLAGTVKCVFQPGEETDGGAEPMINEGVMENPDVDICIALHMDPELQVGTMRVSDGPVYASPDNFEIRIHGKGAHGAEPENAVDPIVIASEIILKIRDLTQKKETPEETVVATTCSVQSGTAYNLIPDTAVLLGTARSYTPQKRAELKNNIGAVAADVCGRFGATYDYIFYELYPPLINDKSVAEQLYQSAVLCMGKENCIYGGGATMAGEDFAYFSQKKPSALWKLGCANPKKGITAPLHSPHFDLDETSMKYGVAVFVDFVLRNLHA